MTDAAVNLEPSPNNLEALWMPFTANRQFKSAPRLLVAAKDMHYTASDGRKILDGVAGLWCINAGHGPILFCIFYLSCLKLKIIFLDFLKELQHLQ